MHARLQRTLAMRRAERTHSREDAHGVVRDGVVDLGLVAPRVETTAVGHAAHPHVVLAVVGKKDVAAPRRDVLVAVAEE